MRKTGEEEDRSGKGKGGWVGRCGGVRSHYFLSAACVVLTVISFITAFTCYVIKHSLVDRYKY